MSDSDPSPPAHIPDHATIEHCLRRVVRHAFKADVDITVKKARAQAEDELGLAPGFFRDAPAWKARSKHVIEAAAAAAAARRSRLARPTPPDRAHPHRQVHGRHEEEKKAATPASHAEDVVEDIDDAEDVVEEGGDAEDVKESEDDAPKSTTRKTRRTAKRATSDEEREEREVVEAPKPQKPSKPSNKAVGDDKRKATGAPDTEDDRPPPHPNPVPAEDGEDDFSDVIDEPPPKKRRPKTSTASSTTTSRPAQKAARDKKAARDLPPHEEEIKKLQGWLVKCGIRKVWGVELKTCDTPRDKIRHLKGMLQDVGMTGRYSQDKATKIREARELKAELESAREFNEQWGGGGGESEEEEEERPRRGLKPKGLIDFGESGDEGSD
ncbi:HIRA-interacting protein 3 [Teratosphaeria destructans]|uniref:HIRA-interacting protein 3 n=1 Tax=Teratosphaeria destructans TaxID=418781 RepID=A0A9W7SKM6_9PEZI|nr:HIRA-interacting protein 3 [Teratosphaeria destructans]